jgi:exo-1,4-beta-D-glucosaminidase
MQSVLHTSSNLTALSQPGADVSSWYRVSSRTTAMAGLIENGVYNDSQLFFSDNLNTVVDRSVFNTPWLYREEFTVNIPSGQHYFLITNGITSKADIYINGVVVASSDYQEGSYGGHKYEITNYLRSGANCLLIQAYPTNYLRDFAMGFVDWNPYPPDNGTGVWRDVEIIQTGPVTLSPLRVVTDYTSGASKVAITVKTNVTNNGGKAVSGTVQGLIRTEDGSQVIPLLQSFSLQAQEEKTIAITVQLANPKIWWPALWGEQPLYTINLDASVSALVSDVANPRRFGIRHVTSHLNSYNDTAFTINGLPFLVLGGGYSPDMFMRWDEDRVRNQFQYMLDMGMNTVRLEGKQEHPELFDLADRMGLMIMAGWECCDKWEGWTVRQKPQPR